MSRQGEVPASKKEKGWGQLVKDERIREANEAKRIIKTDFNEPFKTKPALRQPPKPNPTSTSTSTTPAAQETTAPPPASSSTSSSSSNISSPTSTVTNPTSVSSMSSSGIPKGYNPAIMTPEQVKSAVCLFAALVEVFEHIGTKKTRPLGPLGAGILKSPKDDDDGFCILLYGPTSKKHEFYVDIPISFNFSLLPDLFATFRDVNTNRYYSFQFKNAEDLLTFARLITLIKDFRQSIATKFGGVRRLLIQDLGLGPFDQKIVQHGDFIKVKYDVYLTSEKHPQMVGALMAHKESKRFELGAPQTLPLNLSQGLLGMKKKGTRFFVFPPDFLPEAATLWQIIIPPAATVLVQITVTSVKKRDETKFKSKKSEEYVPTHSTPTPVMTSGGTISRVEGGGPDIGNLFDLQVTPDGGSLTSGGMSQGVLPHHFPGAGAGDITPIGIGSGSGGGSSTAGSTNTPMAQAMATLPVLDVSELLRELQLESYLPTFQQEGVQLADLLLFDSEELKELIPQMGPRKRLLARTKQLKDMRDQALADLTSGATPSTSTVTSPVKSTPLSPDPVAMAAASRAAQLRGKSVSRPGDDSPTSASKSVLSPSGGLSLDDSSLFGDLEFPSKPTPSEPSKEDLLAAEYKRGHQEALQKAKEQVDKIKGQAKAKFAEMESELAAVRESQENQNSKAKQTIERLKEELQTIKEEKEQLKKNLVKSKADHESALEKTRQYVAQVRESKKANKDKMSKVVKDLMGKVHGKVKAVHKPNELYDGAAVEKTTRGIIKQITEAFLESLATEDEA